MRKFFSKFAQKFTILSILIIGGIGVQTIISCSGGDQPNANSGAETSSSSISGGQSSGNDSGPLKKDKISGFSQKGPFTKGSAITLSELNDKLAQTGRTFEEMITDDKGSFEIKNVELVSPYAVFKVNGFYRNEVTGKISTAPINLYAIADIREKSNVNVNILTHLEYYRVQKLVEGGKSLKEAKKQAQKEILAVFGISGEFEDSEDMSIFGTTDGDAALLAISVLLQEDLSEGQFTERLADFSLEFKETGVWNNKVAKRNIAYWAERIYRIGDPTINTEYCQYEPTNEYRNNCWPMPTADNCNSGRRVSTCNNPSVASLPHIRSNILAWNLSSAVPDFEKYVNNYWYADYGLGACDVKQQGGIKKSNGDVDYICKDNAWVYASEYEIDVGGLGSCSAAGEVKEGQVSKTKYICKNNVWVIAPKCLESKSCQTFTDARDKQSYYYVEIGEQTWMAENLNYDAKTTSSVCYNNKPENCTTKYGRFYDWATAKAACPKGWHLPSNDEWDVLTKAVGGEETAGKYLKATSGWNNNGNGEDKYGFSALPGGAGGSGDFYSDGESGYWWSATEYDSDNAYDMYMFYYRESAYYYSNDKDNLFSVRCLKD